MAHKPILDGFVVRDGSVVSLQEGPLWVTDAQKPWVVRTNLDNGFYPYAVKRVPKWPVEKYLKTRVWLFDVSEWTEPMSQLIEDE
jgi:hypothetical protein